MKIKLLSPLWGHEYLPIKHFLDKVKTAGYDGVDTWIPENYSDKHELFEFLQLHEFEIVTHQYRAEGKTFREFRRSFLKHLQVCAEPGPILINSHTGRDYFTFEQNLALIDDALEFSSKTGITVLHETHRGRLGYCPQMISPFFQERADLRLTADLSHWVCVTESMLDNFEEVVNETLLRSLHIHARVGFEQGPQVSDPRAPEWQYALERFLGWWDRIVEINTQRGLEKMPITTEFGPEPYMPKTPHHLNPGSLQFELNCFMRELLAERYQ